MKLNNWNIESCSTVGNGNLILTGAVSLNQSRFRDGLVSGLIFYSILDGANRETGEGTFDGSGAIVRSTIHSTLINGVFNDTNPVAISLSGTAIVSGTFNTFAYEELVTSIANHETRITTNETNIAANTALALTPDQKAALDSSVSPSAGNEYVTKSELNTTSDGLQTHLTDTVDAHDASAISNVAAGSIAATDVQGAIDELDTDVQGHITGIVDAHEGTAIGFSPAGTSLIATDSQAAIAENNVNHDAHLADTADAHDASALSYVNVTSGLTATEVQAAIDEVVVNHGILDQDVHFRETAITALESGSAIAGNGPTAITVNAGRGEVIDSFSDPEIQTVTQVTWIQSTYDLLANAGMPVATGLGYTEVGVDNNGNVVNAPNGFSSAQRRIYIVLGNVDYTDRVITAVKFAPIVSNQIGNVVMDLIDYIELGDRIKGMILRPTALIVPDLSMWRDSGTLFSVGINYENALNDQNVGQIPAIGSVDAAMPDFTPVLYNNGTTLAQAAASVVPTGQFETDGLGSLNNITNGNAVIHYMFETIGAKAHYLVYAQNEYPDYATAKSNLFADRASFSFPVETNKMVLLAQIVVLKNVTVWGATAEIFPLDSATSSGSGTGSATNAINIGYTDTYALGTNVQVALDSLAALKLTTDQHASLATASGTVNPPTVTNPIITKNDLTGVNKLDIDAQTLDGLDSTSFVRNDASNSSITMDALATVDGRDISVDGTALDLVVSDLNTHEADTANPHSTTYANIGGTQPAPVAHVHAQSDVTGLVTSLDAKVDVAGDTMTGQLKGITPVAVSDLTRKDYVDLVRTESQVGKNILINGDLSVNQRGVANWAGVTEGNYGWDRWKKSGSNIIQPIGAGGYKPSAEHTLSGDGVATQQITSPASGTWNITVANTSTWAQVELGDTATDFEIVDPVTQLARCHRYYWKGLAIGSGQGNTYATSGMALLAGPSVSFPVTMRVTPSIVIASEPTYENCSHQAIVVNVGSFLHRLTKDGTSGGFRATNGIYEADAEL